MRPANRLEFVVPLPPRACSPNGQHGHWRTASAGRADYRELVGSLAKNAVRSTAWAMPSLARVSLKFGTKSDRRADSLLPPKSRPYRPLDVPNAISAFKAGFDGLKDAGILVDDSHMHMELGRVSIDPEEHPSVQVTVEVLR